MEVMSVGVISTAHLSQEDLNNCDGGNLVLATDPYSIWLYVSDENIAEAERTDLTTIAAALRYAQRAPDKINWLRLDRDAPAVDGLPVYDW